MATDTRPFGELFAEPTRNGLTRPKAVRGAGVKMVNMGELFAHPRLCNAPMDRVPLSQSEAEKFLLDEGDLLFARQSLVLEGAGKCSIFLRDNEPVTFESHVTRVRLDPAKADPGFYFYYLQSHHGRSAIRSIVEQGAGASGIRGSDLAALEVKWRPLAEQSAIAHILGTLDEKIELNRRMSETLEAMARGLFKSWFVDFDPVRAKAEGRDPGLPKPLDDLFPARLVDSKLCEIPEGWEVKPLGSWADTLSGGTPPKTEARYWNGDIPWISPKVMTSTHADEADAYVAKSAIGNGTRLTEAGTTLVMVRGMGLHQKVRVCQARVDLAFNQDVKALVGTSIDSTLLFFAVLNGQRNLLDRVESSGHGTGKLPTDVLLSLPIIMPEWNIQRRLSEPFHVLNERIATARKESRTLTVMRDTLLPKLISGELRTSAEEQIAEGSA